MTSNKSLSQSRRSRWLSPLFAWLTLAIGLLPIAAQAQSAGTGTVTGRVMNAGTGDYLRNAVVSVEGTNISTIAEAGGSYRLLNVPAGDVKIKAEFAGLDALEQTVTVTADATATKDFNLTNSDYSKDAILLDQFVVSGEKEGNAKALQEQKNAVNIKQVIAADAFGDVSEGNVGEFMKRMSGVAIDYTEADARSIRIRGMNPKYAVVLMDGAPVASAGSSQIGTGRAFELEQLSIASIETIEMSKTPTPDQQASAVAGVVNLRSKGAFDSKGRRITFQASAALNSYDWLEKTNGPDNTSSVKIMPNFTVGYADVLWSGKMGIQAGINYSKTFAEQKAEVVNYRWDTDATNNDTEIPSVLSFAFRDSPKVSTRINYNTRLDFKLSPNAWFYTRLDYNSYEGRFYSRDLNVNFGTTTAGRQTINSKTTAGNPVDPNVEYSWLSQTSQAAYGGVQVHQGGGATNKHGATFTWTSYGEYTAGALKVDAQLQFSRATNWYTDLQDGFVWTAETTTLPGQFRFNRSSTEDVSVQFTQLTGADYRNLSNYNVNRILTTDRRSDDEKYSAQLNARYPFAWKIPTVLKAGIAYNESARNIYYNRNTTALTYVGPDRVANTADDNAAQYRETYVMDFDTKSNAEGLNNLDRWALASVYKNHPEYFGSFTELDQMLLRLRNHWNLGETVNAGYVQTIFKLFSGKVTIAPGLRFEATKTKGKGPNDIGNRNAWLKLGQTPLTTAPTVASHGGDFVWQYNLARYGLDEYRRTKYNDLFKYLHASYNIQPNLVLRASYHEAITRPDLANIFDGYTLNETNSTVTANNPALKPEKSRNLNADISYYFGKSGNNSLTFGVFRSDIRDLQVRQTYRSITDGIIPGTDLSYPELAGTMYDYSVWKNKDKAHNSGFEAGYNQNLTFLPGALGGLSMFANYTHLMYDKWSNYLNSPKDTANLGISHNYKKFESRISYNWTGYFLTGNAPNAGSADAGIASYVRARGLTDVNFAYKLNRNLRLFANGRNIFNEGRMEYRMLSNVLTRQARFGALWTVGVSGKY